jgi:hypothetical protein
MAVNEQTTALIATFSDRHQAELYVDALRRAGFKDEEIGVLTPHTEETHVEESAVAGAITGGIIGAAAGVVATGLIPGIGPVLATGLLAGILGGAAAGATAGGVLGALISLGIPESDARRYEEEFLAGRTLVAVQAVGRGGEALAILRRCDRSLGPRRHPSAPEEAPVGRTRPQVAPGRVPGGTRASS